MSYIIINKYIKKAVKDIMDYNLEANSTVREREDKYLANAIRLSDRRHFLAKNMPLCPLCHTKQVQLVDHIYADKAQWKCRHCKHKFEYEPSIDK